MIEWAGVYHIMATPFTEAGALDADGLPRLVERALETGITGFTVLGIAGEAHRLTDDERRQVVETVVKETRGRVPVAVGVSASGTHLAAALARMARDAGAQALMLAPPNGVKNLDAVRAYYHDVAAATSLPIVLQDEPVTTQVTMPAPFIASVTDELALIEAVKLEEAPTLPKITRLRALFTRRVAIFGGLGGCYFFEELSRGADGAMTGFPYPEALRAIRDAFVAGRRDAARALFYRWLPLIRYESQPGSTPGTSIAIRKEILRRRGWIASSCARPPAAALDPGTLDELSELLAAVVG
ncbi:MAG TPA: dihydrodipicolinate synthase family protein [Verrucomicrobiae bacterium]|jgi:4-hydroxy-tetrahydrodipicolinate synthase|nr:dihydrodipicolinate synthase family protein [Verrucomicrobiae bacterium]